MELALIVLAGAVLAAAIIIGVALMRGRAPAPSDPLQARLEAMSAADSEAKGRLMQALAGLVGRVEALDKRLGDSLADSATKTAQTLGGIQARLGVIDEAQKNITTLSGQMMSLQDILSDKQTRGAFGQDRMEAIVSDQLPPGHYEFQYALSNGSRPDCIIRIPNMEAVIVVDSKFPLEAFESLRTAASDEEKKLACARIRADVQKHVKDIADKYLIPGETQTPALMFVPSESIYAELHMNFSDAVQRARRAQVVIVSPHVFMLAINTIQTLMRDARMREQAHRIQQEVGVLLADVNRLGERIANLRGHFDRANKDIGEIETSMKKVAARAGQIEAVELAPAESPPAALAGPS